MTLPRTLAFYGLLGAGNIGNDASFETMLHWIEENRPDMRVRAITTHPDALQAAFSVPSESLSLVSAGQPCARWGRFGHILGRLADLPRSLLLIQGVDMVIVAGMGVLEDSIRVSPGGLPLLMLSMATACRIEGRKFILLDVGADVSSNRWTDLIFRMTARMASHVSYRDRRSAMAMCPKRSSAQPESFMVVPDMVFAHPGRSLVAMVPDTMIIGLMRVGSPQQQDEYLVRMFCLVESLLNQGYPVALVGGDSSDYAVAEEIVDRLDRRAVCHVDLRIAPVENYDDLLRCLAGARVVIASRYHNLVAALSLSRPTISLGYASKCGDLLEAAGQAEYCHEMDDFSVVEVLRHARYAWDHHEDIGCSIRRATASYPKEIEGLLEEVLPGPSGR